MKNFKYLILIFILFFCFSFKVNAYTNYDTSFDVSIPEQLFDTTLIDTENSFLDVMNNIKDLGLNSTYYDFVIESVKNTNGLNSITITLYPKGLDNLEFYSYSSNGNPNTFSLFTPYLDNFYRPYSFTLSKISQGSIYNTTNYISLSNCLLNNTSCGSTTFFYSLSTNRSVDSSFENSNLSVNFDNVYNNNSYPTSILYFSSLPLKLISYSPSSSAYYKSLIINNTSYSFNDIVPSYYDLYINPEPEYEFIGYSTSLKTFYTNLDISDVSNYNLKVKFKVPQSYLGFYQTPTEYVNNTQFNYVCSGRVDNTDYYFYETFPCSLDYTYLLTESTIEYIFNNLSYNQNLSNYDKIYVTIKSNYLDSNVSTTIFNYSYQYNLGSFYNTDYKGSIYENFNNLPLNFKVYLSSNNSLTDSNLYVRKYQFLNYNIKYIGFSNITNQQNLVIGNSVLGRANSELLEGPVEETEFLQTNVTNSIDQGIMIYQDNSLIPLPSLQLFFNGGVIISINNSTNDFYYIDSNGNITNNTFTRPLITDTTKYDISYYLNQVSDFINDLSNDTLELSLLTQEFYNGMPMIFQTFILVIFILSCTYFLFVLIKRW